MNEVIEFLKTTNIVGIPLYSYISAFFIILVTLIFSKIFSNYIADKLLFFTKTTKSEIDDIIVKIIHKPLSLFIIICGIALANNILLYPEKIKEVRNIINVIVKMAITVNIGWFLMRAVDSLSLYLERFTLKTKTQLDDQMTGLLRKSLKVLIIFTAFLLILQNLGYSVSGLVAGLGIGGLALALAAKEFISNFFGFITILLDNPFRIGDWIKLKETEGDVEDIGFRSTVIRGFDKTTYSVPNSIIANTIIQNYQRMPKRRVKIFIGISYDSKSEDIKRSLSDIRSFLRNDKDINQEFFLVNFRDFRDNCLNIMIYYFTKTTVWKEYENIRERVNLEIMKIFENNNIKITKPTVLKGKLNLDKTNDD